MSEIAVKPIVWGGPESRISEGGILPYWVGGGTKERLYGGQRTASPLGEFATLDEAKAAAQADYERSIRSAINTPAVDTKDAEIARLREALQKIISSDDTGPMIYESRENGPSQAVGGSEGKFAAIARAALKGSAQ